MRRRVVITGIGLVTPLGIGTEKTWKSLLAGRSGVGQVTLFDASTFPSRIAAEVKDSEFAAYLHAEPELFRYMGRNSIFAIIAARLACRDAGIEPGTVEPDRFGVYTGSGEGALDFDNFVNTIIKNSNEAAVDCDGFMVDAADILSGLQELEQEPNMPSGHLASLFNARGPNANCLTACAASSQAVGEALEIVRRCDADVMLTGGTHSMIHPFGMAGFCLLTALSTRNDEPTKASRPFDKGRDGFILGEGAGMLVIEEYEHAVRRGAVPYCELVGYGSTADAFRITDTHPEGRGAAASITLALKDAGIAPEDIDYINAHGTSTVVNDRIETLAIKRVFGDVAYRIPVSSVKSMFGHLIAAAGAVEVGVCALATRDGIIPPTINCEEPDPDCDLDYVPNEARPLKVKVALSNSFGFGGQNVTLITRAIDNARQPVAQDGSPG